ncbi:GDP-mannose 4,6-dehydratase [Eggerthella sinensis]|uniref:GDP-mannose 4,6-dehydratase n=1 Tax=Eggerthella sinensis TaxID=242230 RepID=UPI001D06D501|nr:GDP-mannose 4,6-dehydratase [Eggerthella sinensis]MCB7039341.1 GDP-mannose 4,6-dehydratase [Eggerthella sinensis]
MPRVLVFGSEGFVGPWLAKELKSHDYEVVGSDRVANASRSSCDWYQCVDLADDGQVKSAVEAAKPDAIVNLAAISSVGVSWKLPQETFRVNAIGTLNILEAARELCSEAAVLLIGSGECYVPSMEQHVESDPLDASSPYGISKTTQDQLAKVYAERYGMRVLRVRPFNHTGVGQSETFVLPNWCRQAAEVSLGLREPIMRVGNLEAERDFSDVRDVVRAYRLVLEGAQAGSVYNIGSGSCLSLRKMLQMVLDAAGVRSEVEVDPALLRPVDNPRSACDAFCIRDRLGWEPEIAISQTLAEMITYMKDKCR